MHLHWTNNKHYYKTHQSNRRECSKDHDIEKCHDTLLRQRKTHTHTPSQRQLQNHAVKPVRGTEKHQQKYMQIKSRKQQSPHHTVTQPLENATECTQETTTNTYTTYFGMGYTGQTQQRTNGQTQYRGPSEVIRENKSTRYRRRTLKWLLNMDYGHVAVSIVFEVIIESSLWNCSLLNAIEHY